MTHYIVTAENIEDVRENIAPIDQRKELSVGCETWSFVYGGGQVGQMTVWPEEKQGAVFFGADSDWGDWNPEDRPLTLDDGTVIDEDGNTVEEEVLYEAVRYAADGCAGEVNPVGDSDNEVICTGTLEECRDAISQRVGQMDDRRWDGGDIDVEAYHDSDDEGCGGYSIRRVGAESKVNDE